VTHNPLVLNIQPCWNADRIAGRVSREWYRIKVEVSGARPSVPDGIFAPCELVCELGARPNPVYVVRSAVGAGKSRLVIAERFPGSAKPGEAKSAELVREAQRISTLANPYVARAREVALRGDDLVVFGDFIDGEKLAALWSPNTLTLEIALRAIIDVLSGLSALHNLRDAQQQPMKLAHGEVSPATIVFGLDGAARVLEAVARRVPGVRAEAASLGYLAPETHRREAYDARADVFSAGVLLWEALAGERLFTETDAGAIVARVRVKAVPVASVPEKAAWARGLADVAARALAALPEDRWPTAAAMAAEIRKLAGPKLAPTSTASAFARNVIADRVKARRERLEPTHSSAPPARPMVSTRSVSSRPLPDPPSPPVVPARTAHPGTPPLAPSPVREPAGREFAPKQEPGRQLEPAERAFAAKQEPIPVARVIIVDGTTPAPPPPVQVVPPPSPPPSVHVASPPPPPPVQVVPPPRSTVPAVEMPVSSSPGTHAAPMMTTPAVTEDSEPGLPRAGGGARGRKAIVLGGVGALGVIVFGLAAWRINQGNTAATRAAVAYTAETQPAARTTPAAPPRPTVVANSAPPPIAPPALIASAVPNPTPPLPAAPAAPSRAGAAAKPKSPQAAAPAPTHPKLVPAPSAARRQPKSKPTFEPDSL